MKFSLPQIGEALHTGAHLPPVEVTGWSVDSRSLCPGDLYFALQGPNHDGHAFLKDAFARGACAAVVSAPDAAGGPLLPVPDTLTALQTIAAWARLQWSGKMVAITGSAGKTTTKEIVAAFLSTALRTGKTAGNLNNHVGLPLSILRLPPDTEAAVIEIGMNHAGEIRRLASIARPDIGVVTNVGFAHAEYFGSIDGVALAKRELIESLPPQGTAILNADDSRVIRFREVHPGPAVTYGLSPEADVHPEAVEYSADGLRFGICGHDFHSTFTGRHGMLNLLAGFAAARAFGIRPGVLQDALDSLQPGNMRGERLAHAGISVLNDCYNSNPEAARAMLDVLRATPARRRFAVLGEMLELGQWSETLHAELGRYAVACGVDVLVGIRGAARQMVEEAVRSGLPADAAFFFDNPAEAGRFLRDRTREGDAVLFKGSRGTHVEFALQTFLE